MTFRVNGSDPNAGEETKHVTTIVILYKYTSVQDLRREEFLTEADIKKGRNGEE